MAKRPVGDLSLSMKKAFKKMKGNDTFQLGDDFSPLVLDDVLSTGLPNLDKILAVASDGRWGVPVGKIMSIKSKPSVGKTTFLLRLADQCIARGGAVYFIESEHALDITYARKLSKNVDSFLITQPETLEEAFESAKVAVTLCEKARSVDKSDAPFLIIMDSFSGFTTGAELSGSFGTSGKALGEHARIASLACRKLTGPIARAKATLILSHQVKSRLGVFWGNNETNIGGDAFNYHDSICLNFYRGMTIKDKKKEVLGHYGTAKTTKNKLFTPHKSVKFKIINGNGFNRSFAILDFLILHRHVIKKGAWFHFKADRSLKWQGADGFVAFMKTSGEAKKLTKGYLK